ncbi:hypothetical protein DFH11DRAFT_1690694 [Phellopilus nigrolimitatus]|nr:hypothetical protein DFH11DRAFT_1690694 [Phellopilus nigrolimitatus]
MLETLPPEVILHILSYLDIPELDALSCISPTLKILTQDPLLHRIRISVVAPSRIQHSLFALGGALRPTVPDLVHWGVLRGLGLERRWRMGLYLNSRESVKQYETSKRLQLSRVRHVLSTHLQHKAPPELARILPDGEAPSSVRAIAPRLLPAVRSLKWSIRRDKFARMVRDRETSSAIAGLPGSANGSGTRTGSSMLSWFEGKGRGLWKENERVRLAICPGVGKFVRFYENLSK